MTQHPITPPPELVQQWLAQRADYEKGFNELLIEAAQWGYEQHEKELLDAMHAVVPQPYEPEAE